MTKLEDARRQLALAQQEEYATLIAEAKLRIAATLSFDDAASVVEKGYDGKWFRCSPDDERRIIRSIAGVNLIRSTLGQTYLESFLDRGLLLVVSHNGAIEPHPLYTLEELEKKEKALAALVNVDYNTQQTIAAMTAVMQ